MKRYISILLVFVLLIPLVSCGKKDKKPDESTTEPPVTTAEPDAPAVTGPALADGVETVVFVQRAMGGEVVLVSESSVEPVAFPLTADERPGNEKQGYSFAVAVLKDGGVTLKSFPKADLTKLSVGNSASSNLYEPGSKTVDGKGFAADAFIVVHASGTPHLKLMNAVNLTDTYRIDLYRESDIYYSADGSIRYAYIRTGDDGWTTAYGVAGYRFIDKREEENNFEKYGPKKGIYVTVGFDRGACDFGPFTPGTRTSGIQEALDVCAVLDLDLYIQGPGGYAITETIHIQPRQDFSIWGSNYVIGWQGPPDQDMMWIDSAMNCEYHFGILVYGGTKSAMLIKPINPVPWDKVPVFVESRIVSAGIADPLPFTPGKREPGTALTFDGVLARIYSSHFYFIGGILNFDECVKSVGGVHHNNIEFYNLHSFAVDSVLMKADRSFTHNNVLINVGADVGSGGMRGIELDGSYNDVEIHNITDMKGFIEGELLVLGSNASYNTVKLTTFEPDFYIYDAITDKASNPTNYVLSDKLPPKTALIFKDSVLKHQQRLYPAAVYIAGGSDVTVFLTREKVTDELPYGGGMTVILSPGDTLVINCSEEPSVTAVPQR